MRPRNSRFSLRTGLAALHIGGCRPGSPTGGVVAKGTGLLALVAVAIICGACDLLNPDRQLVTRDGSAARLVQDSPDIERLLSIQRTRDAEGDTFWREKHSSESVTKRVENMRLNPERYAPGREAFLLAMSRSAALSVPGHTYARLVQQSGARCNLNPITTSSYVKVLITSGPLRGNQGWMCEDSLVRTTIWP